MTRSTKTMSGSFRRCAYRSSTISSISTITHRPHGVLAGQTPAGHHKARPAIDAPVISYVLIPLFPDRGLSFSPGKPMIRDGRLRHGD